MLALILDSGARHTTLMYSHLSSTLMSTAWMLSSTPIEVETCAELWISNIHFWDILKYGEYWIFLHAQINKLGLVCVCVGGGGGHWGIIPGINYFRT